MAKFLLNDESIAVCIKPAGLLSEGGGENSLVTVLKNELGTDIFPVHRLDRETSGIMVYAKNPSAAATLSKQITEGKIKKRYYAVLRGEPAEKSAVLEDLLFRDKQRNKTFVVDRMRKGVRPASLEYEIKGKAQGLSLADILLHTGRTHQIRAQFSSRKLPLYGDGRYGGGSGELALFAYSLSFAHPVTGEKLEFRAKPDVTAYPWSLFGEIL